MPLSRSDSTLRAHCWACVLLLKVLVCGGRPARRTFPRQNWPRFSMVAIGQISWLAFHSTRHRHCPKTVPKCSKSSHSENNSDPGNFLDPCSADVSEWWAVLGSNQWPMPCETEGRGLRINRMRGQTPFTRGAWYHLMSFDITQCHDRSVPELSQRPGIHRNVGIARYVDGQAIPSHSSRVLSCHGSLLSK